MRHLFLVTKLRQSGRQERCRHAFFLVAQLDHPQPTRPKQPDIMSGRVSARGHVVSMWLKANKFSSGHKFRTVLSVKQKAMPTFPAWTHSLRFHSVTITVPSLYFCSCSVPVVTPAAPFSG